SRCRQCGLRLGFCFGFLGLIRCGRGGFNFSSLGIICGDGGWKWLIIFTLVFFFFFFFFLITRVDRAGDLWPWRWWTAYGRFGCIVNWGGGDWGSTVDVL